jgi:hypothetical protein
MRTDKSDRHGLDTAYQIHQALAWLGGGEESWKQGGAWLERSLGAWLRPVKQTRQDAEKASSFLLASLRGSLYDTEYDSPLRSLRPCLGQGAFQGEEAVLADSGLEGEVSARVGRARSLAFLSILLGQGRYGWLLVRGLARRCVGELVFQSMET